MNQDIVVKLTAGDGTGVPVDITQNPPLLYTNMKALFPTVTFSERATPDEIEPYWYGVWEWVSPPSPQTIPFDKIVKETGIKKCEDGVWRHTFELVDAPQDVVEERIAEIAEKVRITRRRLLKHSDYTQMDDAPESVKANKEAWKVYRQALRDITLQKGFPLDVIWPEEP